MSEKECEICANEEEKFIKCSQCSFEYCVSCFMKHLLSLNVLFPFCMNCKHIFNLDFISMNTVPNFHNKKYRDHRAKFLLEHEKSLLPQTQGLVQKEKRIKECNERLKIVRNIISDLSKKYNDATSHIDKTIEMKGATRYILSDRERQNVLDQNYHILQDIEIYVNEKTRLTSEIFYIKNGGVNPNLKKIVDTNVIGRCTAKHCSGFIDKKGIGFVACGLCSTEFCDKCHKEISNQHKCLQEDIDTVKELKDNTKACPKCAALIFKIAGCNQMFCTACTTTFNWDTLEIVTRNFHNPHYIEWRRRHGNVPRQNTEGDEDFARAIAEGREDQYQRLVLGRRDRCVPLDTEFFLHGNFIDEGDCPFPEKIRGKLYWEYKKLKEHKYKNEETCDNKDLRIAYLLNEIDDKHFLKMVKMREKRREKDSSIYLILQMYCDTMNDMFIKASTASQNRRVLEIIVQEIIGLRKFVTDSLANVQQKFEGVVPTLWAIDMQK